MHSANDEERIPGLVYQERDFEIIDYRMYCDKNTGLWLRGPEPERLEKGRYIACVG